MEGTKVRTARAEAGLTLIELSKRAGVTRDTISKIERNVHEPQAGTLAKIAKALDRPVGYFIEGSKPGKDDAPLSPEWVKAATPEEFARTIGKSHTVILKDLYEELQRESMRWFRSDSNAPDPVPEGRVEQIRNEVRRRDPPAFSIKTTRDTIEVRWLVPMKDRAPYKELLSERLRKIVEGKGNQE